MTGIKSNADLSGALGGLITAATEPGMLWADSDLRDMLQHQLATPLAIDLAPEVTSSGVATCGLDGMTFGDLLHSTNPDLSLLRRVKHFAKAIRQNPAGALPPEIATMLYFASTAAAIVHHDARIGSMSEGSLREGLEWAMAQPWALPEIVRLVSRAMQKLN